MTLPRPPPSPPILHARSLGGRNGKKSGKKAGMKAGIQAGVGGLEQVVTKDVSMIVACVGVAAAPR